MELLLPGNEKTVLSFKADPALVDRIDLLAGRCAEGELTSDERQEYEGYVEASMFVSILAAKAGRRLRAKEA